MQSMRRPIFSVYILKILKLHFQFSSVINKRSYDCEVEWVWMVYSIMEEGGGVIDLSSYHVIEIMLPLMRRRIFSELQSVSSRLCKCMLIVKMVTLRKGIIGNQNIKFFNFLLHKFVGQNT